MKYLLAALLLFSAKGLYAQYSVTQYDTKLSVYPSNPDNLYVFNGKLYFYANDSTHNKELCSGDGVNFPTIVADINPSGDGAQLDQYGWINDRMCGINGILYFTANNGINGHELWKYDGTNPPTMVKDHVPGTMGCYPRNMATANGKLYFTAFADSAEAAAFTALSLYEYDPGTGNMNLVLKSGNRVYFGTSAFYKQLIAANNKLYFRGSSSDSFKYYCYDPSTSTFTKFGDVRPGYTAPTSSWLYYWNSKFYFSADDGSHGVELYEYDGTNTSRLTDINPGSGNGVGISFTGFKNKLYFHGKPSTGVNAGYVYDFGTSSVSLDTFYWKIGFWDNNLNFVNGAGAVELNNKLIYNGNIAASPNIKVGEPTVYNNVDSPKMLIDLLPGSSNSNPQDFVIMGKKVFFIADNLGSGHPSKVYMLTDSSIIDTTTAIRNEKKLPVITVYPNPANEVINISLNLEKTQQLSLMITNNEGHVVYKNANTTYNAGNTVIAIPARQFATGIYYYHIRRSDGITLYHGNVIKL